MTVCRVLPSVGTGKCREGKGMDVYCRQVAAAVDAQDGSGLAVLLNTTQRGAMTDVAAAVNVVRVRRIESETDPPLLLCFMCLCLSLSLSLSLCVGACVCVRVAPCCFCVSRAPWITWRAPFSPTALTCWRRSI